MNGRVQNKSRLSVYITGYILSLYLTVGAYLLVHYRLYGRITLLVLIVSLALVQCVVQLLFFMHLAMDQRPRWRLFVFLFMLLVVCILVFGSIWIMDNLNYRMTPNQVNNYLNDQDNL